MIPTNTILIVDDEDESIKMLDIDLSSLGYKIIKAHSGTECVRKAVDLRPNLIVLDILMPDLDGGQVTKLLKANEVTRNIPVIFLTAVVTKEE